MQELKSFVAVLGFLALGGVAALMAALKHADLDDLASAHVQKYNCKMHPDVFQNTPGDCPKCGLKLVHHD